MEKNTIFAIFVVAAVGIALIFAGLQEKDAINETPDGKLKRFSSESELVSFLKTNSEQMMNGGIYGSSRMMVTDTAAMPMLASKTLESAGASGGTSDFSTTNIQVEGVDEADIIKNDGKYIYTVSGNKLVIIDAYPAGNANIISETELKGTPQEIFVNKDRVTVFGNYYKTEDIMTKVKNIRPDILPPQRGYSGSYTYIQVYDIKDRSEPVLKRDIVLRGDYYDSRMIGEYAYAVVNMPVYYYEGGTVPMPLISENGAAKETPASDIYYFDYPDYSYNYLNIISVNTQKDEESYESKTFLSSYAQNMHVSTGNIYVTYTTSNYMYRIEPMVEEVLMPVMPTDIRENMRKAMDSNGTSGTKLNDITKVFEDYTESLSDKQKEDLQNKMQEKMADYEEKMMKEWQKTAIHKIAISNGKITYEGQGSVPGTVLNQFSMDENNGYFRIATTTRESWSGGMRMMASASAGKSETKMTALQTQQVDTATVSKIAAVEPANTAPTATVIRPMPISPPPAQPTSKNNIYVLDSDMKIIGKLEDLAPGESIYSARFMGNRAYMVTFKKIDPLFVIDLKNPYEPKLLGKLKIPGYSDYLHPYDENHVIGLGKEAIGAEEGDFAWYQGIKLALFDVSDPENPKEISKFNIGDRGTDSYALHEHKAFLFDKEKKLLVIPITLAEIDKSKYADEKLPPYAYGEFTWQGAYVLSLDTESGFKLKGRISHVEDDSLQKSGYYYYSPYSVKRSLYIGNVLYTLSDKLVKMNDLSSMEELNKVKLPYSEQSNVYYVE